MRPPLLPVLLALGATALAQAPGVPTTRDTRGAPKELIDAAVKVRDAGEAISQDTVREQLSRKTCELTLPPAGEKDLPGREIWRRGRAAHIRVGYVYLCTKCNNQHFNLAGGYAITADGVVATCFHVVEPKDMKEGHLLAASDDGTLMPVVEVLAADRANDVALIRVKSPQPLTPLPLERNVQPGDDAWCYSDPFGRNSYFSHGIVNRFFERTLQTGAKSVRMNVSTDWAPGSSGSAVLDSRGNAIGHVSEISAQGNSSSSPSAPAQSPKPNQTYIIFHDAVRAADVLALIKRVP